MTNKARHVERPEGGGRFYRKGPEVRQQIGTDARPEHELHRLERVGAAAPVARPVLREIMHMLPQQTIQIGIIIAKEEPEAATGAADCDTCGYRQIREHVGQHIHERGKWQVLEMRRGCFGIGRRVSAIGKNIRRLFGVVAAIAFRAPIAIAPFRAPGIGVDRVITRRGRSCDHHRVDSFENYQRDGGRRIRLRKRPND